MTPAALRERDELHALLHAKDGEVRRLVAEVEQLREELADASRQLVAADAENGRLLGLHITLARLAEAPDRAAALDALSDVVINIVGSEDFALYERGIAVASMGDRAAAHPTLDGESPLVRDAIASGRVRLGSPGDVPLACAPLMIGRDVRVVLVVFGLLPHRGALGARDIEVLELLRVHGATALLATELRTSATQAPGDR